MAKVDESGLCVAAEEFVEEDVDWVREVDGDGLPESGGF